METSARTDEQKALYENLDKALANAPQLQQPLVVWRGAFRSSGLAGTEPTWQPPAVSEWDSFEFWTSVSLLREYAMAEAYLWGTPASTDRSILWQLRLPAGLPHIYMEAVKDKPTADAELLLPRGLHYRVTTSARMVDVALSAGFASPPHFYAYFVAGEVPAPCA
jgi:hypothetical protein